MRTLLVWLALCAPAMAQQYYPGYSPYGWQRPIQPVQRIYIQQPRYQALPLYGYSYGPNIYGDYSSAFNPSPIISQPVIVGPYGW